MAYAIDENGIQFIEKWEGCVLTAYQDQAGVWTIGVGHTPSYPGQTITQDEADALLQADIQAAVNCINSRVIVALTQNQVNALASFIFNDGVGAFSTSSMLMLLNSGDMAGAAAQFQRWDKIEVNGQLVPDQGLLNRRLAEAALFAS